MITDLSFSLLPPFIFLDFLLFLCCWAKQPHFVSGYTGVSTSEGGGGAEQPPNAVSNDQEMSENDQKVIQELKDWDLWYVFVLHSSVYFGRGVGWVVYSPLVTLLMGEIYK